ncbi:hypothetical protein CTI14_13595 [Methylobacterium radiotolerans]|nr:hypothetical protein CTI14_13595 [Methylobacterium radiotolerans]
MSELFNDLAGQSEQYFTIGGVSFYAAPFTLMEYVLYQNLPSEELADRAEFLADQLSRRIRGTATKPETITRDWLMDNLPLPRLPYLETVLLTGKPPKDGGTGKP